MPALRRLYDKGIENGVPDLKILDREEVLKMEPNVADDVYAALYAPTAGIVCPFSLNIALAENAYMNGIDFKFDTEVQEIVKIENGYEIRTDNGTFQTGYVVNAAGVYADKFHNMVSRKKIHIVPGEGTTVSSIKMPAAMWGGRYLRFRQNMAKACWSHRPCTEIC